MTFTIATQKETFFQKAKPWLTYLILFLFLGGVAYAVSMGMHELPALRQKSTISVSTTTPGAEVYLNTNIIGTTPLESVEISPKGGELRVQDSNDPTRAYETTIAAAPNTEISIRRDLGVSEFFSSGHDLWLQKDKTNLTVISQPSGAIISIDDSDVGKTPFSLDTITEGSYDVKISMPGFETQTIRIRIVKGYRLNVAAQLFPIPVPSNARLFEESGGLWDLTINDENVAASPERARAVSYWMETRPNAMVLGDNEDVKFDYYLDYRGNLYDASGIPVNTQEELESLETTGTGAYLGFDTRTPGLTTEAREAFLALGGTSERATVLATGTGWLRVRSAPNLSGEEIGRVNTGETYGVLEKQPGWVKIQASNDTQGWVSADFVRVE